MRSRSRKPRRAALPHGAQLDYYAALKRIVAFARKLVQARVIERLPELLQRAEDLHTDAAQHPGKRINALMQGVANTFDRIYPQARLERIARAAATVTNNHQRVQLQKQMKSAAGVDLGVIADRKTAPAINLFVAENVALIRTVPQRYFDDVETEVLRGMRAGTRAQELAGALEERASVAQNRAKLIARDQVLKFNGDLNRVRQTNLGVESYTWATAEDERVRPAHAERDGQVYRWDDPPGDPTDPAIGGHPGVAINCRCQALPNVEELLAGLED